jgi:hypothetical protein
LDPLATESKFQQWVLLRVIFLGFF